MSSTTNTHQAPPPPPPPNKTLRVATPDSRLTIPKTASPTPSIDAAGLSKDLTSPTSPQTPHGAADAARCMSSTGEWQPRMDRRQSWSSQDYRHEQQKPMLAGPPPTDGVGFTERAA